VKYWYFIFFSNYSAQTAICITKNKKTFDIVIKNKILASNWTIEQFYKTYACDLEWAKTLEYCKTSADGASQPQGTLDEYVGFYAGKDDEGKDHRQEIKISGTNLVTSTKHKVAGDLTIILTPTGTKDVFSVDIKNSLTNKTPVFLIRG
jgi:hypothetical protein